MNDPLHPFRSELRAYCYRMMGSVHDAEDVLQEVGLRAWRADDAFEGRASRRTWLYRIATNACLNELRRKERRILPSDLGPAENGSAGDIGEPRTEVMWLEPLADDPEQGTLVRESVELAFVSAIQHLTPNQRAALVLADVLGYSAGEVAELLGATDSAVSSALGRARQVLRERLPDRGEAAARSTEVEQAQREVALRYAAAMRRRDLPELLNMLADDATWSMPPLPMWFRGHDAIAAFVRTGPFTVTWRHRPTSANNQPAVAAYAWNSDTKTYEAYAVDVLELREGRIVSIVSFIDADLFASFGLPSTLPSD